MEILALSRRISILLGVCSPTDESDFKAELCQILTILFIIINIVIMESSFIMNALYQLEVGNIVELLNAVLLTAGTTTALSSYISIVYQRKNTRRLFNTLQTTFGKINSSLFVFH